MVGSPDDKPLFTNVTKAGSIPYPGSEEAPTFDEELPALAPAEPSQGIRNRYWEIARRAARGERNCDIARALGYTQAWISTVMTDPFVQAEIKKCRDAIMETDAMNRLKLAAPDAAERLHKSIRDPLDNKGIEASKFVLEMTYGKPKQAVSVESGSLTAFMEMLGQMRAREVSPAKLGPESSALASADAAPDEFDSWLDEHLPPP